MAADNQILRGFASFKGVDRRSSDLTRSADHASDLLNVDFRDTGAIHKRSGYQAKLQDKGGHGLAVYSDVDTTNGNIVEKLIAIDDNLHVKSTETLTITYTGIDTAYVDLYLDADSGEFYCDLYDDNSLVMHQALGKGIEEALPYTVTQLKAAIDLITNFSSVISAGGTEPAAYLNITRNQDITASGSAIGFEIWNQVSTPGTFTNPFSLHNAAIADTEFENASFANINNVIFISTGYDALMKYDGVRVYKAGLPTNTIDSVTATAVGASGPTGPNIQYKAIYSYTDAKGNLVDGIASDLTAKVSPGGQEVDIVVDNILEASGYDTDSSNLTIRLYRNLAEDSTTFYFVKAVTNDGSSATQTITDDINDADIGEPFLEPIVEHGLPPIGKYCTVIQGVLVISGDKLNVNTVYYSDIESPEYFPAGAKSFNVDTVIGDKVVGIGPQGLNLYVFKNRSIHLVSGEINEDRFRTDLLNNSSVGCAAHSTIKEVEGSLVFLTTKGVYQVFGTNIQELSDIIHSDFSTNRSVFNFKRAAAEHYVTKDKYMVHIPSFTGTYSNEDSRVYVYDYYRKAWLIWDSINATGGIALLDDSLYFTEIRNDSVLGVTFNSLKFQDTGDTWDYADHTEAISWEYKTHWEAMSNPSIFKKFLRLKIHSLDSSQSDFESDSFTIDVITQLDYIPNTSSSLTYDFSGGSTGGWGLSSWGTFPWGNSRLYSLKAKLKSAKAKSMRIIYSNATLHENVLISGYELEVATPYGNFIKE